MSSPSPGPHASTPVGARRDPFTGAQIRIGVMGSAGEMEPAVAESCRRLGRAIADRGICLLTGACPGAPHEVVLSTKEPGLKSFMTLTRTYSSTVCWRDSRHLGTRVRATQPLFVRRPE